MGWEIAQRITLPSTDQGGGAAGDSLRMALAIEGNYLIVSKYGGAANAADPANQQVYWYQRKNDGSWKLEHTARASDPEIGGVDGDQFGIGVSICGNDAIVGENQATSGGPGRVHFYRRGNDGQWKFQKTINGETNNGLFGMTVWISKQYAIVGDINAGAAGAVYIYKKGNDGEWNFHQRINGDVAGENAGGGVVRINDNYAMFMNGNGGPGVFYFYTNNNEGTFERKSKTTFNIGAGATAAARQSVGVYGNNIIASCGGDNADATQNSVCFYQRQNDGIKGLNAPGGEHPPFNDQTATNRFGRKSAIYGNFAVSVNGPAAADGTLTFYRRKNDGIWVLEDTDTPAFGANRNGLLGQFDGLDIHGNYVAVTAPYADNVAAGTGQVFIYERKY